MGAVHKGRPQKTTVFDTPRPHLSAWIFFKNKCDVIYLLTNVARFVVIHDPKVSG